MNVYDALKEMRMLSDNNIPFSIKFISYNESDNHSNGLKEVSMCLLRKGMHKDKSNKSQLLVGYVDLAYNSNKWFYLPLLIEYNNKAID